MSLLSSAGLCLAATVAQTPPAVEEPPVQTASQVDEIVVLGTRNTRDATIGAGAVTQRMSRSSRSVEQDLLQAVGATRLVDALQLVSGVSQQNNRGGVMDNFAIRGFLGTPDGGSEYYVDGFLANRGMAPPRDPATSERIEILKGPAGALFGDIDPAGRVNIVSRTPRFRRDMSLELTVGSFGLRRAEVDLNAPLTDVLAGRLVIAAEQSDGWRDHVDLERTVVAPSLTWRPTDALRLTYVSELTRFDTPFDRGVPAVNGDALALPRSRYFGEPNDGVTEFRNERHQITGEYELNDDWSLNGGLAYRTGTLQGLSSDHSRLVGQTLWRQRRGRDFSVEDLSARLELNGRIDGALGIHRVAVGVKGYTLDYGERWLRRNPSADFPYGIDIYNPVYGQPASDPAPFTDNLETREVVSLYAQDMWEVTDRLTLLGGVRFDHYRQTILKRLTNETSETEEGPVDFHAAARFRLNNTWTAHASYGESFVLNSGTGRTGAAFAPETSNGFELGVSGAWDRGDLAITLFDVEKANILTNDPVDPNYLAPVGRLTSRGVEIDGSFRVGENWQVVANYAWTDAEADDEAFATDAVLNVPEHSGGLFAVGRFTTSHDTDWSMTAGAAYVGDRAGAIDGSGVRLPAYWDAEASVDYGITDRVSARLEVDNLFDAHYAESSYSSLWIFPGAPRIVRASIRISL